MNEQSLSDMRNITAGAAHVKSATSYAVQTPASASSQQQIKLLAASNACLRRNLVRFSYGLKQVGHLAFHDELTGLPNRSLLLDRLQQAMLQGARQYKQVLLLFIDLDRFKVINDKLGYIAGDHLLQQVAMRLSARIRGADTVSRYGGDEFVVMLPEMESAQSATAAVQKIRAQLATPYVIEDHVVTLTASVGAAIFRGDQQSREYLLRQAELDMNRSKVKSKPPLVTPI